MPQLSLRPLKALLESDPEVASFMILVERDEVADDGSPLIEYAYDGRLESLEAFAGLATLAAALQVPDTDLEIKGA